MRHLGDQFLRYVHVKVGHEAEATALPADGVPDDLRLLDLTVLLEMTRKVLVSQAVVEATNKDLLTHTLRQLLFLSLGRASRAVTRPTASATLSTAIYIIVTSGARVTILASTSTLIVIV